MKNNEQECNEHTSGNNVKHLDMFIIRLDGTPLYKLGKLEWTDETRTQVKFVEHENS